MALVRPYHKYRGVDSFTASELIAVAGNLVPGVAPTQTRYRVGAVPTARSLRFYTARGLVDKPLRSDGGPARYGYRHLLQLLVVKSLQSQYLPLVKIRSLTREASNRELEQFLPDVAPPPPRALIGDRAPALADEAGADPHPAPETVPAGVDAWLRIEVGPGIELHVHHAALSPGDRERLRGALLREMGRIRGWAAPG